MKKLILTITCCLALAINASAQQRVLKPGDTLHNIALKSTKGQIYELAKQKAKGFILIFMTPSCDHCLAYEKRIVALNSKYQPKGFPVVGIGPYGDNEKDYPHDAMSAMKKLAESKGFTFPYLADEKFRYTWLFDIRQTPKAVVLKKQKQGFSVVYIGNIDDQPDEKKTATKKYVEEEVNKLLAGNVH
ncbi:redoxin domain-containing protein [Pedobacter sp.]|uniref:redoxin domain-containing protein n=1 Tax=Pedobacter sp. TaxID=1411316 RepID=UPI0031DF132D